MMTNSSTSPPADTGTTTSSPVFPSSPSINVETRTGDAEPSMTFSLLVSWVFPVLILALLSRYTIHLEPPKEIVPKPRPVTVQFDTTSATPKKPTAKPITVSPLPQTDPSSSSSSSSSSISNFPTNYLTLVETIERRRRHVGKFRTHQHSSSSSYTTAKRQSGPTTHENDNDHEGDASSSSKGTRGPSSDPERLRLQKKISKLKKIYEKNPEDIFKAIDLADAYRKYELKYHDGGLYEDEAIKMFQAVVAIAEERRQEAIDAGKATNLGPHGETVAATVNDELTLDYPAKSPDGLLCAVTAAQGKVLYMANMFSQSVKSYSRCLEVAPYYLDALDARASSYIVLGMYEEAARDYLEVIQRDQQRLMFAQAYTGLARVLEARESVTKEGWGSVVGILDSVIPELEAKVEVFPQGAKLLAPTLNRLHHVMFTYHDVKTKDYPEAFRHLTKSFDYKMSVLSPWNKGYESEKAAQTRAIFKEGFWPPGMGSRTRVPIFIIGFVRSGSTLLERVLDAHPLIVGTGENSVFNGRLDDIRNKIVEVSTSGQPDMLGPVTRQLAEEVVSEMKRRWDVLEANTETPPDEVKVDPKRFVDKMLTNYFNVGFIHLLYPKALILHVAREPMDTIFSAYKHEFPTGTLDYTSDFEALAEMYHAYRDLMEHWDKVLPGRVIHIRYADMVQDMPGVARAIINATGLPWNESVLDFHKKKHAVNTLSSTQVRKGVYTHSLKAWMRYEDQLEPLVELIGDRVEFDLKTTLPTYSNKGTSPPPVDSTVAAAEEDAHDSKPNDEL